MRIRQRYVVNAVGINGSNSTYTCKQILKGTRIKILK